MAAEKNGNTGSSGMLSTQKAAPRPTSPSSRSTSASRKRNDHAGGSDSQVVNTPRRTWYRLSPSRSIRSRSEEHTSELQSRFDLVCRLLLEKKKKKKKTTAI